MKLRKTTLYRLLAALVGLSIACQACTTNAGNQNPQKATFLSLRKAYSTVLTKHGPAPQEWNDENNLSGITQVAYPSGNLNLKAYLAMPRNLEENAPAVVCFHGGFAFDVGDFNNCQPFLDAGFAVFIPTFRGENGNPGDFELFYGEVDDARAAILWLRSQPHIDTNRMYTFGHSTGGGVSALLALWDDVPIRFGGSAGGLYPNDTFFGWKGFAPFDVNNDTERSLRVLVGNTAYMKRKHIAYVGSDDTPLRKGASIAESEIKETGAPLTIKIVDGDHFTSLAAATSDFIAAIKADK